MSTSRHAHSILLASMFFIALLLSKSMRAQEIIGLDQVTTSTGFNNPITAPTLTPSQPNELAFLFVDGFFASTNMPPCQGSQTSFLTGMSSPWLWAGLSTDNHSVFTVVPNAPFVDSGNGPAAPDAYPFWDLTSTPISGTGTAAFPSPCLPDDWSAILALFKYDGTSLPGPPVAQFAAVGFRGTQTVSGWGLNRDPGFPTFLIGYMVWQTDNYGINPTISDPLGNVYTTIADVQTASQPNTAFPSAGTRMRVFICNNFKGASGVNTLTITIPSSPDGNANAIYMTAVVYPKAVTPSDPGPCNECEAAAGQPINLSTGDVWLSKADYSVPGLAGGLSLTRTWNSLWNLSGPPFLAGMFGTGWTSDFEERLQTLSSTEIEYWRGTGNTWTFQQPSGCPSCAYGVLTPPNQHASLAFNSTTNLYTITFADGTTKTFSAQGYLKAVTDRNGNQTAVAYDTSNRITNVAAPGGQSLTFTYGLAGDPNRVTSIQDSVGAVATYTYANSLLTQAAYPDGSQLNYSYDSNNNVAGVTDSQGKVIETHTYDGSGRGLTSARANGVDAVTVQYSSGSTTLTDSMNNTTTYSYTTIGGSNFLTGILGPGCSSCGGRNNQTFALDSSGNRTSTADPNGNMTSYTYDSSGNVLTKTDAIGTWTYSYNGFGQVLTAKDPLGNTTTNVYDAKGNLISTTTPSPNGGTTAGSKTRFAYDAKGELTLITDPLGNSTGLTYYSSGLVNTTKDPQANTTTFAYDGRGNRTSIKDALGSVTSFAYDVMSRLTQITYPNNSAAQFGYDYRGRRVLLTDGNGKSTTYAYDDADRLVSTKDASGNITQRSYDTENNLTSITDALNHATNFSYDDLDRLIKTLFPSGLSETYTYDNNGNLTGKTDRNGNLVTYAYDQRNRLIQKSYPDSTSVSYSYDSDNRVTQVVDPTGTYQFTYDDMGRLIGTTTNYSFIAGTSFTTHYGYDAGSNRKSYTDPMGSIASYDYDTLNRLSKMTPPTAVAAGSFGFSYDALNRRTQLTRPNGITTSYTYDALSHLLSIVHASSASTVDGASYAVDAIGTRTSRTSLPSGAPLNYTYDAIYELLSATQSGATNESYTYDAVGNRLSSLNVASYSYNPSNELVLTSTGGYAYDNDGNLTSKTDSTGTTNYAWDFEGRLTQVALSASGGTVTFRYDPFGRRIQKVFSQGTSATTTNYIYDGENITEMVDQSGKVLTRFAQGEEVDEPLSQLRAGAISYYEQDGLGSVTSLTSSSGAIAQTYAYDSFGNTTSSSGNLVNPFRYTGREFDSETGLYYYRARYYDPNTGRFLSEDPIRFSGGINLYRYVGNNAVNEADPQGTNYQDCKDALKELAQAAKRVAERTAENAVHGGRLDPGHAKALRQALNQLYNALDKVQRHCGCVVKLAIEVAAAVAVAQAIAAAAEAALAGAAAVAAG